MHSLHLCWQYVHCTIEPTIYIHMHIGENVSQVTSEMNITSSGIVMSVHCTGQFENKL